MPKTFITERDVDDLKARGVTSIDLNDNVVITDLAIERAMRYEIKINRESHNSAPKASFSPSVNIYAAYPRDTAAAEPDLKQKIKAAVLARLDGQVDPALLDAVITRVLSAMQ